MRQRVARMSWIGALILLMMSAHAGACPPGGAGGDRALNHFKNRVTPPARYHLLTVAEFLRTYPLLHTPRRTTLYTPQEAAAITPREQAGVELEGYLLAAKQSGPESTNCYSTTRRDDHVWIGAVRPASPAAARAERAEAVVVEPTPNTLARHPIWRLRTLRALARQGAKVRVFGWVMYDPEHPDQLGKTRGTLWEVHPVTRIEVWSGGRWRDI